MYQIIDEKIIGRKVDTNSDFLQLKVVHIVCDTAASVPEPLPEWAAGSRCDVLADSGNVYILSISGEWKQVNFYNRGGSGGDFDPDSYYTKPQTDARITEKVAEIVADAPEDFDTLKEMSDWIASHEDSAAAMNSAIQQNTTAIAGKVDKVSGKGLSTNDYTTEEKTKLSGIANDATDIGRLYPNSSNGEIFNNYISNKASGNYSHAEGNNTTASGNYSHAEGNYCVAGNYSHAEGNYCAASGGYSHAEGSNCKALGNYSHASGNYTIAKTTAQTVIGKYNVSDDNNAYAFVIGNGSADNTRSNAFAVGWNGLIYQNNSETGVDLNNKVDKVSGKGLSTNDYTTEEKDKLSEIETGANKTVVDSALSSSSTNPVQNKAVKAALDSKAEATVMNAVGLRLVASNVQQSNDPYTYQMSKDDFDKSELGTYIISIVTWSTTPKYSLYAVSYTGNSVYRALIVKIAGDDMTVTSEDGIISVSGLSAFGGKISIHALQ